MMRTVGILVAILGGVFAFWVMFFFDTTVATPIGRVNNIGLMADKQNYIIIGSLLLVVGLVMYYFGKDEEEDDLSSSSLEKKDEVKVEEIKFWQKERNLSDDAYKIHLVKKYNIEKNEALGKIIANEAMYETIEDALKSISEYDAMKEEEHKAFITSKAYVKDEGKIGYGYEYKEYGDGSVTISHSSGMVKNFTSIEEARNHFK
jgi:hypothetical protein